MKKFFLTMLVGLLPIIGWAQEVPEPFLVEDYTEYAGNQTPQPIVVNGTITKISYLGLEGTDPATVVFDAATPPSYTVPVRNAGFYEVEAVDQTGAAVAEPFVYEVGPFEITVSPTPIQRIYGDILT